MDYNKKVSPNTFEKEKLYKTFEQFFDKTGNFMLDRFQKLLSDNEFNIH